jgi:hypothetical protein
MAIEDDFLVQANGDIRHTGANTDTYTVIEFHRWLGDLMDDAQASGDDFLDITDATASERATDNYITLNSPYNIDDTTAQYLYDGSIVQDGGDTIYDGLVVLGGASMPLHIMQNGSLVSPLFWDNGDQSGPNINANTTAGITHRFMLKVRSGGSDIDGRRIIGMTREFGKTYSEFKINGTSRGNNVLALTYADDLNNETANATVAAWSTINNTTQGYAPIDVEQTGNNYFYSEWNRDSYTINQFYERMKYISQAQANATTSITTNYGLNGNIFRGITHQIVIDNPSGDFDPVEAVSWSGGTGQMLAIDNETAGTKMWIQLLTGVAPTDGEVITGSNSSATAQTNVTVTERTISTPFIGSSTGSALIGAYGVGVEYADLTNLDKLTDLDAQLRTPPNNVQFQVGGLSTATGGDRILVAPLGYYFPYENEANGAFNVGDYLTFSGGANGYLSELLDKGTTGFMKIRLVTGDPPEADEGIVSNPAGAIANVTSDAVVSEDPRQLKLETTLNGAAETEANCTSAIPSDTPSSGSIRVQTDDNRYLRIAYSSFDNTTFTFTGSQNMTGANAATGGAGETGNGLYVSYIDKNATSATESFTVVYSANRGVFIRVRFGDSSAPIKTFETSGTVTASGGTATAIRTTDV